MRRLFVLLGVFAIGGLFADDCYYLCTGAGSWAEPARWKDGKVPQEGDNAYVDSGAAFVTADDLEVVSRLRAIVLVNASDSVEFVLADTFHCTCRIIGEGTIRKSGAGSLYLDAFFAELLKTSGGIVVDDGEVHLSEDDGAADDKTFAYGPLTVNAPGKIFLRPRGLSTCPGIAGDGLITNISLTARQLIIGSNVFSRAGTPYAFRGTVAPTVSLNFNGAELQEMYGDNSCDLDVRGMTGTVGVGHFGAAGKPGSLGLSTFWLTGNLTCAPFRLLYLGEGEETTDKSFRMSSAQQGVVFDGGSHGELTLSGDVYLTRSLGGAVTTLYLDGSNSTSCVFAAKVLECQTDASVAASLVKRGSGIWRIEERPGSELRGGIAVEKGVLEFPTVAAAGSFCSLGYGSVWQSPYYGAYDAAKTVPYALSLGDGTVPALGDDSTVGTLSYVGTAPVICTTRPIALNGAGRLRNASDQPFSWTGFTSASNGDNALLLDGAGTGNKVYDVTNGVGRLAIVQEGEGKWTVDGNVDVSALESRKGELSVKVVENYTWYRFNVKRTWGDDLSLMITRLALLTEDGDCRNLELKHNASADGNVGALNVGQYAYWTTGYAGSRPLENVFVENSEVPGDDDNCTIYNSLAGKAPDPDDEATWIRFVMRLVDGAPVTRYDICGSTVNGSNGTPFMREPATWSIEGSCDGRTWTELAAVTNNPTKTASKLMWYSSQTANFCRGYAVRSEATNTGVLKLSAVDCVQVSSNGTVSVDKPVLAKAIRCDLSAGGGTLRGFAFGTVGEMRLVNVRGPLGDIDLGLTVAECTGIENLTDWTVFVNGRRKKMSLRVSDAGCVSAVRNGGSLLIVR